MDERAVTRPEDLVHELLGAFMVSDPSDSPEPDVPVKNPEGLLSALEEWGTTHPAAIDGMTRVAIAASAGGASTLPLAPLMADLAECVLAFNELTEDRIDDFLRLREPRVCTAPNGTTKWALLTAVTDRVALTRQILAVTSPRSHRTERPPTVKLHFAEAHAPEELRKALGLSLREALAITEQNPGAAMKLFDPIIAMLTPSNPEIATITAWLVSNAPEALMHMPTTRALVDAVQGHVEPRAEMDLRFAHLLDLEGLGYCAMLMWDTAARLDRGQRAVLAGHIRHLADTAIAPWNRYADLRRRREAFAVWARQLRDEPVGAERLAERLRAGHPGDYQGEAIATTVRRVYRLSTQLRSVRMSPALSRAVREARGSTTDDERNLQ